MKVNRKKKPMGYWCNRSISVLDSYVGLVLTEEQFRNELEWFQVPWREWLKTPQADATTHFMKSKKGTSVTIICIRIKPEMGPLEIAGLLVHEAVHVFQRHCEFIGEDSPSLEYEAYAIQHISQQLMNAYVKLTKEEP